MNPQKNTAKGLRKAEVDLDQWEDGLPEWFDVAIRKPLKPAVSGSSSLQLGFFAVKLLIRRIRLHVRRYRGPLFSLLTWNRTQPNRQARSSNSSTIRVNAEKVRWRLLTSYSHSRVSIFKSSGFRVSHIPQYACMY